ncbi:unnamed protein product [Cylicocyclus nassatus]|uniref:Zinc metalloproteinase n=1 Tax=Cylicocyclus nassatus TaxID=53992 RepID=A0AA36ME77_CYLNA|nr:unnamed protein product [Cylicocyclus nassatus]
MSGVEPSERSFKRLNQNFSNILYDGDIIISEKRLRELVDDIGSQQSGRKARPRRWAYRDNLYPETIWRNGIPYAFDVDLPAVAVASIRKAMEFWQSNTCVTFRPRKNERQYALFTGRDTTEPEQLVFIGDGCEIFGVTSHEVGHLIGLFHHQQRYDRDEYVTYHQENVDRGETVNFAKVSPNLLNNYGLPYDVGSVMHYAPTEFARHIFFPALMAVNENLQGAMGQLEGPSFLDVQIVNRHYNCHDLCKGRRTLPKCLNGGYVNPLNCRVCKCPTGFGGDFCQQIASSYPSKCGGLLPTASTFTRFKITIIAESTRRQCIYHIRSPPNRRVMIGLETVKGKCQEGCFTTAMEVKMNGDFRPVGYRYCCQSQSFRRLLSRGRNVPVIFFAQNGTLEVTMLFRWVVLTPDAEDNTSLTPSELMEVYVQRDNDSGVDMEMLQIPEGFGTPGGGVMNRKRTLNDMGVKESVKPLHEAYGSDGEIYEDFSIYS